MSKTHVVTAAHCFESCPDRKDGEVTKDLTGFRVVVGKARMNDARDNVMVTEIKNLKVCVQLILLTGPVLCIRTDMYCTDPS